MSITDEKHNNAVEQEKIIRELLHQISDPMNKRIISAYGGDDPVASMEGELAKILLGIWKNENKKP